MLARFCIILLVIVGIQSWILPMVDARLVARLISCSGAILLLFCAVSSLMVPVCIGGNRMIHKFPFLQKQLGTIWMSGALIGVFMFCLGVVYALRR